MIKWLFYHTWIDCIKVMAKFPFEHWLSPRFLRPGMTKITLAALLFTFALLFWLLLALPFTPFKLLLLLLTLLLTLTIWKIKTIKKDFWKRTWSYQGNDTRHKTQKIEGIRSTKNSIHILTSSFLFALFDVHYGEITAFDNVVNVFIFYFNVFGLVLMSDLLQFQS